MLTLDEAVANLDELLAPTWEAGLVSAEGSSTQRLRTWTPTALAVRAAVRDVALAMLMAAYDEGFAYARAEIIRLLGPEKAGG